VSTETTPRHPRWPHLPAQPWMFTGQYRAVFQAIPGDPNCPVQPGASCDHCSTAISDCYGFIATKTGETFKVGCDCVRKMVAELETPSKALTAAVREAKKARNEKARTRAAAKRASVKDQARELLEQRRELAAAKPHPNAWRAEQGNTLADWAAWMLENGGGPAAKRVVTELEALA
jgi:hypothetical protein